MSSPSSAAADHFNRASQAMAEEDFDLAIAEFDACLTSEHSADMAVLAYFNLDQAISSKFDFFNRKGWSLSDYECAWSLRGQDCLNKAIEIYEQSNRLFQGETAAMLADLYRDAVESRNSGMAFGVTKMGDDGEPYPRDFDAVARIQLPPLRCLDEKTSPSDRTAEGVEREFRPSEMPIKKKGCASSTSTISVLLVALVIGAVVVFSIGVVLNSNTKSSPATSSAQPQTAGTMRSINANELNLRSGPGRTYSVIKVFTRNERIVTFGDPQVVNGEQWIEASTPDGQMRGWIARKFLSP